jgi:sporulation protein YlmC with PRC-barrel domain
MAIQFILGSTVSCADGPGGRLARIIFDPAKRTVTHLIVEPTRRGGVGRLVPVNFTQTASGDIQLSCTLAQIDQFAPADDVELAIGTDYAGHIAKDAVLGVEEPSAEAAAASSPEVRPANQTPMVTVDQVPDGESELVRHERVHAADGEIGQIKGFTVDQADYQVTEVLLREGHLWGSKEVAIPISAVASMEDGIKLHITKKQAEDLPAIR